MNANKRLGAHTIRFGSPPAVLASGCTAGRKEGQGPLYKTIDVLYDDDLIGQDSWEKAESHMQREALDQALKKASVEIGAMDMVFAGDLLNQCVGSTFGLRECGVPFYGLYGACSTMAESLSLAAICIDGGFAARAAALTSSHYCSAERQYRLPLDYGAQRAPTAQWTVTGAGAVLLGTRGPGPFITHAATGKIVDAGITDAANMGAAMAPVDVIIGPYRKCPSHTNGAAVTTARQGAPSGAPCLASMRLGQDFFLLSAVRCFAFCQDTHNGPAMQIVE